MRCAPFGLIAGIFCGSAFAQTVVRPTFDVASIKLAAPGETAIYRFEHGRAAFVNFSLKDLMLVGWHILPFQESGGPAWTNSERYDIEAKAGNNPDQAESRLMLQSLLSDRFHLAVHREIKELPVYALIMARADGRVGRGLVESTPGACIPTADDFPPAPAPDQRPWCGVRGTSQSAPNGGRFLQLRARGITLARLARNLSSVLVQHVEDETGSSGMFDVTLDYSLDSDLLSGQAPPLSTALQEQLGLKLVSRNGPVEVYVIDHAEHPSAN